MKSRFIYKVIEQLKFDELLEVEQHSDRPARGRDTAKLVTAVAKIEIEGIEVSDQFLGTF